MNHLHPHHHGKHLHHPNHSTFKGMTNITVLSIMITKDMGMGTDNEGKNHSLKSYLIRE
jgi:hypothetical protein